MHVYSCFSLCSAKAKAEHCAGLCTVAHRASLSMGFFQARILQWLPFPTPGALPNPAIEPASLVSLALTGRFFTTSTTWETSIMFEIVLNGIWID